MALKPLVHLDRHDTLWCDLRNTRDPVDLDLAGVDDVRLRLEHAETGRSLEIPGRVVQDRKATVEFVADAREGDDIVGIWRAEVVVARPDGWERTFPFPGLLEIGGEQTA